MSVVIKSDEKKDWRVTEGVEGLDHDHCPNCETDVEPIDGFGGENGIPRFWSQYSHDMKNDGSACGAAWTRTSRAGLERNEQRGQQTKWLTTGAATGRVYSVPSREYEKGWERIFGSNR